MKESLKREIGLRMRKIRKALGFTQEKMVSHFNIGRANYSRIEKGEVLPNATVLNCLRTQFGVSLDWLIAECGHMFVRSEDQDRAKKTPDRKVDLSNCSEEIRELLLTMDQVSMVKHAMLSFFLEYKARHKEIIREALGKNRPSSTINNNGAQQ
jgi:transcriptional regulator with XRE-family HTH domain